MKTIRVADWSERPGAAKREHGPFSGEEFRELILEPAFLEARAADVMLLVDLDGVWGYAYSFLKEAFGGLARKYGSDAVHYTLLYKSDDEPQLEFDIRGAVAEHDAQPGGDDI